MRREMCWEWNWPYRLPGNSWGIVFDFHILRHDHSPGCHCSVVVGRWVLLDFSYYNSYHLND